MLSMFRSLPGLALVAALVFATAAPGATQDRSGTIEISSTTIAVGIGVNWGEGTLTLNNGSKYRFTVDNLKIGSVGISTVQAVGSVYNLTNVQNFEGNYVAAEAGMVIGGGISGLTMRNEKGVGINLQTTQAGLNFTFGLGGMAIKLKQ